MKLNGNQPGGKGEGGTGENLPNGYSEQYLGDWYSYNHDWGIIKAIHVTKIPNN